MASTYMGKPYYLAWLDNLADDVTGEGRRGTVPSKARRLFMKSWSPQKRYMSFKTSATPAHARKTVSSRTTPHRSAVRPFTSLMATAVICDAALEYGPPSPYSGLPGREFCAQYLHHTIPDEVSELDGPHLSRPRIEDVIVWVIHATPWDSFLVR